MKTSLKILKIGVLALLFITAATSLQAQDRKPIIVSGYVIDAQTKQPLAGVTVIIPSAGVGINTSEKGTFQFKVFAGDSLVFRYIGYSKAYYLIPEDKTSNYSVVIPLSEEIQVLDAVKIVPYADQNSFREAFMKLETEETRQLRKNVSKEKIQEGAKTNAMDGQANHLNYSKQQTEQIHSQTTVQSVNIFSPTAWRQFIRDLKQDLKKK